MPRALMDAFGRALRIGRRAQTTCSECCGEQPAIFYLRACPCRPDAGSCAIPNEPCIYVDTRSTINGLTGDALIDGAVDITIRVEGVCYSLEDQRFFDDHLNGPLSVPDGAVKVGGPGVTIEYRENCVDGCAPINLGPEYFEAFQCSGCVPVPGFKYYVCARAAQGMEVVYDNTSSAVLCIDRSVGYTLARVLSMSAAGHYEIQIIDEPSPLLVWTGGGSYPRLLPARSCCFSPLPGTCNPIDCLRGRNWTQFGGDVDRWFPLDICCGTRQGFTYGVDFTFNRVQAQDFGNGDTLTTSISVRVDRVTRFNGQIVVEITQTQRSQRPSQGIDVTNTSPANVFLDPICCLTDSSQVPRMSRFVDNFTPIPVVPGYFYSTRELKDPDRAIARRLAWSQSAFGTSFQLAFNDGTGTYASTGNTDDSRNCGQMNFKHWERVVSGNTRTEVSINLSVTSIPDQSAPCGFNGPCGANGWGSGLAGLLP